MTARRSRSESGLTLIEVMLSAAFLTIVGLMLSSWISRPATVQTTMLNIDMKRQADSAINQFASDLQSADPISISWSNLPPQNPLNYSSPLSFKIPQYDYVNGTAAPSVTVQYELKATGQGMGKLVRTYNGAEQVLLMNMALPTATLPLVAQDTTSINGAMLYNMLVINLTYRPPGSVHPMTVMRRVAVTG